jgi:prephenate dehydratase
MLTRKISTDALGHTGIVLVLINSMNHSAPILLALLAGLHLTSAAASEATMAFLGPKGSYSDEAATEYASRAHLAGTTPLSGITEIAQIVRDGRVQFGLLPFENSIGGFVNETHRLLLAPQEPAWRVIADVSIPISNNLLVKPGTRPSDLRKIVSHPEALKECASWLKINFPQLPQEDISSTAAAAEAVSKSDGTIAAIASSAAARVYQLEVLFSNIEDDQHNATNFVVIQPAGREFLEQNPTRLIVRVDVSKGADTLARLLEALDHLSFTLTSADSAPTGTLGSHRFALILDSKSGADLGQIQNLVSPAGALLIGAYRPSSIAP